MVVRGRPVDPRRIMVMPSYFHLMLDEMEKQGIDPKTTSIEVDIFGLSEVIGPGVAQECVETMDGLHIWEDHFYPEVVNPLTDEPVEDGQMGELVFTSLTKQAMPVMLYRTRDLTKLLPGTARPAFRRMEKVTGRTDDLMIVRGVNVFPTQIEEIVLGVPGLSPYFQCELTRSGRMDELTVNVEADPSVSWTSRPALAREVQTLDALHLASAILVDADLLVAYDQRLLDAATAHGISVSSPGG